MHTTAYSPHAVGIVSQTLGPPVQHPIHMAGANVSHGTYEHPPRAPTVPQRCRNPTTTRQPSFLLRKPRRSGPLDKELATRRGLRGGLASPSHAADGWRGGHADVQAARVPVAAARKPVVKCQAAASGGYGLPPAPASSLHRPHRPPHLPSASGAVSCPFSSSGRFVVASPGRVSLLSCNGHTMLRDQQAHRNQFHAAEECPLLARDVE
jgi:hypothetical protein